MAPLEERSPSPASSDATLPDHRYDPWHGAFGPSPRLPSYSEAIGFSNTPFSWEKSDGNLPRLTVYGPTRPNSTGFNAHTKVNEFEVTAKDAQRLLNLCRTLLSDLSYLHGEFASKHSLALTRFSSPSPATAPSTLYSNSALQSICSGDALTTEMPSKTTSRALARRWAR